MSGCGCEWRGGLKHSHTSRDKASKQNKQAKQASKTSKQAKQTDLEKFVVTGAHGTAGLVEALGCVFRQRRLHHLDDFDHRVGHHLGRAFQVGLVCDRWRRWRREA